MTDPNQAWEIVSEHYAREENFVGAMGENDPGVWFAVPHSDPCDILEYCIPLVLPAVELIREERHGIPFSICTSGILSSSTTTPSATALIEEIPWEELDLASIQVSLVAANPRSYQQATGCNDDRQFGSVCAVIAALAERELPVEVSVLHSEAGPARELAVSLGARQVHVYDE